MTDLPIYMTTAKASEMFGVGKDAIRKAYRSGVIEALYITATPVMRTADLIAWVEAAPKERTNA